MELNVVHASIADSNSTTNSDTDTDSENIFYSTYHDNNKRNVQSKVKLNSTILSSTCTFRLNIKRGMLTAYSPVRVSVQKTIEHV